MHASLEFVIYSANESATNGGAGFWSKTNGWVEFDEASVFTRSESETMGLPASTGQDAKWVLRDEANKHYGGELDEFRHEVALCIDCMLQDDAVGETIVFVREGSSLVPKTMSADAIELNHLTQYEMILFDSGNKFGDCWKHVFYPKLKQHHFVDENPQPQAQPAPCAMEVSVDGGLTYQPAPSGVRIIYKDVIIDEDERLGEVHINATHEGLITDIWTTREEPLDHNIGTDSVLIDDIVARLVEDTD